MRVLNLEEMLAVAGGCGGRRSYKPRCGGWGKHSGKDSGKCGSGKGSSKCGKRSGKDSGKCGGGSSEDTPSNEN